MVIISESQLGDKQWPQTVLPKYKLSCFGRTKRKAKGQTIRPGAELRERRAEKSTAKDSICMRYVNNKFRSFCRATFSAVTQNGLRTIQGLGTFAFAFVFV